MTANQSTILKTTLDPLDFLNSPETLATLEQTASLFIHPQDNLVKIFASSRDWFQEEWGRDTFISLPGLLISTKRYEDAKKVFLNFSQYEKNGLIPNVIRNGEPSYNTTDASLWFIHALKAYVHATDDWQFLNQLFPTIRNIITGYSNGTFYTRGDQRFYISADAVDGLIISPSQATWMDADPSGNGSEAITPRNGKAVEVNALWYGALKFVIAAAKRFNEHADTSALDARANLVRNSFQEKFWNEKESCLFDVIDGDPHSAAIRPNQIFAISHGDDLLTDEQQLQVLTVVTKELLTAGGLRSLSPRDSQYLGQYDTSAPMSVKDLAYHQGTIWPWLIGPYCDAYRIVKAKQGIATESINQEIGSIIAPLVQFCLDSEFKSLPEVFSADLPHDPGGTTSQAWSVAEVLRILKTI